MDSSSQQLSQQLQAGRAPAAWSGKNLDLSLKQYLEVLKLRAEFYKVLFLWGSELG
jgi:hypothetical protein